MGKVQMSRRDFLRFMGVSSVFAGLSAGCGSRLPAGVSKSAEVEKTNSDNTIKILQQTHFVPAYDEWFDKEYAKKWGEENGVEVLVEHLPFASLYARAAAEASARSGHDLFGFVSPPSAFENEVLDLTDVVQEIEGKVGQMNTIAKNSTYNPKTKKQFGLVDFWAPDPVHWRKDLWEAAEPGSTPDTWEDILRVGQKLKNMGYPIGIGISSELDSNCGLRGLLYSYGASEQDAEGNVAINSPQTIEALKVAAAIYKETMTPEVLAWSASSNNAYLLSGTGSLVMNAVSGLRAVEKKKPDLAKNILLWKVPAGAAQRMAPQNVLGTYIIWKFSPKAELAKKFLVDLIVNYDTAFRKSEGYNLPAFPGSVPSLKELVAKDAAGDPPDKYNLLSSAEEWSTNLGYPGMSNAAVNEAVDAFIIPKMFALVAQGQMKPEEAAKWAEAAMIPIFGKWRERGLV